jgi:bifunctional non-homologous end joining protein LigD
MALRDYKKKRDFSQTKEPRGKVAKGKGGLVFVVQKHDATRLHYDFRLELNGVLLSWAVPKGPSINPADKRLAVHVEDHPFDYKDFEGTIPEGNYGAGDVIVWDNGTYTHPDAKNRKEAEKLLVSGYEKGRLDIELSGKKLRGRFALSRMKDGKNWLLIKKNDEFAGVEDVTLDERSIISKKALRTKAPDMPRDVRPMLATLADAPFDGKDWLFEVKWDGYRAIAEIMHGDVKLYSRNGRDFSKKYGPIVEALATFGYDAVLDGEVVALDNAGISRFQLLQQYEEKPVALVYYVFDILYLNGEDLRGKSLVERKKILKKIVPKKSIIRYSEHIEETGIEFFEAAAKQGLEGIMAKRKSGIYISRRTDDWLKIKTSKRQEAVIAGYTEPRGSRKKFGALVLGVYEGNELAYIGHTGGGFDEESLAVVYERILPLSTKTSPFAIAPKTNMPVTWVRPEVVCEVKFAEWTEGGTMRQPIFIGLREDKSAREVVREKEKGVEKVKEKKKREKATILHKKVALTNLDKVYFPKDGYTKGDIVDYYDKISEYILPYLKDRPESLNRHPNGIDKPNFFQKNVEGELPAFIRTHVVRSESGGKDVRYIICDNKETLLYMANLGCIEINPWNSRIVPPGGSDFLIIDLDPSGRPFSDLIKVAKTVHKILDLACEKNYVKTSGKRGLHIVVPLGGRYDHGQVKDFAHLLSTYVYRELPDITSLERKPEKRKDKIYLDYLQNNFAQTLVAPYSLRPKDGAPVSTPLRWEEVNSRLDPKRFTIKTIWKRLKKEGDIWKPVLTEKVDLSESIKCIEKELEESETKRKRPPY